MGAWEAAARGEVVAGVAGHGGGERRCREAAGTRVAGRRPREGKKVGERES